MTVTERFLSGVKWGAADIPVQYYAMPAPPNLWMTDVSISARPSALEAYNGELFFTVTNLTDQLSKFPTATLGGRAVGDPTFFGRFDAIGRSFTAGVRLRI